MSAIHAKLAKAKAKAKAAQAQEPAPPSPQGPRTARPPLPQKPVPGTQNWPATRSRGRPRKLVTKEHLTLPPIELFMRECLVPNPDASEFIGSTAKRVAKLADGGFVRVAREYPRPTLSSEFIEFCKDRGYLAVLPRSFGNLLVKAGLEAGWVVSLTRASDSRRWVMRGVALRNQPVWLGIEDRQLAGHIDRRRWEKKA